MRRTDAAVIAAACGWLTAVRADGSRIRDVNDWRALSGPIATLQAAHENKR